MEHWLIVTSAENFKRDRELNFRVIGVSSRFRRQVGGMQPEDRVVYYIARANEFGATSTLQGKPFKDESELWAQRFTGGAFESLGGTCQSRPDHVHNDKEMVDIQDVVDRWHSPLHLWGYAITTSKMVSG